MKSIEGRRVLVTGSSRGIGLEIARAFLRSGARVMLNGRQSRPLQAARSTLARVGEVHAYCADVSHCGQCQQLLEQVGQKLGGVDILINNAGLAWSGPFHEQSFHGIDAMVDVNIKGMLYLCRGALPSMMKRRQGTIINISSGAGHHGMPSLATYCATKFAVNGFTEALAGELTAHGIDVFAVCPGRVATEMQEQVSGRRQGIPPETVAKRVLGLAAGRERVTSGDCLDVTR